MRRLLLVFLFVLFQFGLPNSSLAKPNVLIESTQFRLQVRHRSEYLHMEERNDARPNNTPSLAQRVPGGWLSARWSLEPVAGEKYFRIRNQWKGDYLHTEFGRIDASVNVPDGWWSAMWELEGVPGTQYVRLKNRWKGQYLHTEYGELDLRENVPSGWWSAMWELTPVKTAQQYGNYPGRCTVGFYTPQPVTDLCPNSAQGHLKHGDAHFDRAVHTKINLNYLGLPTSQNELTAHVSLHMRPAGWVMLNAKVSALWKRTLYAAPADKVVHSATFSGLDSLTGDSAERWLPEAGFELWACNDGAQHVIEFPPSSFADHAVAVGDTGGADVSTDTNCSCDAKVVAVRFKPIAICLEDRGEYEERIRTMPPAVIQ